MHRMLMPHVALIIVDVQNAFTAGGTLPVPRGSAVVPLINELSSRFFHVVATQDWHPAGHASFASSHDQEPFTTAELAYGTQVLWPDHCVQGTEDAELHPGLDTTHVNLIIRKGMNPEIDSYSAFKEADRLTPTGLEGYLRARGVTMVYVAGLATDYCVAWTALDAADLGFAVAVLEDACRAIDKGGSLDRAWADMEKKGVVCMQTSELYDCLAD